MGFSLSPPTRRFRPRLFQRGEFCPLNLLAYPPSLSSMALHQILNSAPGNRSAQHSSLLSKHQQQVESCHCPTQFRTKASTRGASVAKFTNARSLVRAEATTSSSSIIQEARVTVGEEIPRGSAIHSVTVIDRQKGVTHKFDVPEDQYILHTGEDQGKELPFSCRHGCCTACAVRVKSGQLYQPEALGISAELKEQGYALLCVGYALSDLEVETQDEDEVYWLQFGRYFARGPVERDDYALELAMADE